MTAPGQQNWVGRLPLVDRFGQKLCAIEPGTDTAAPGIALGFPILAQDDSRFLVLVFMYFLGLRTLFSVILISFKPCQDYFIFFRFLFSCFNFRYLCNST